MRLMHGMIKFAIVAVRSFGVDVHRGSVLTPLLLIVL